MGEYIYEDWDGIRYREAQISDLTGCTLKSITGAEQYSEKITFETECGRTFEMHHPQECCESVNLEDIAGEIEDLIGSPLAMAEEAVDENEGGDGLLRWTFYKLGTSKGYVSLRWLGSSNGYYGVSVNITEILPPEET